MDKLLNREYIILELIPTTSRKDTGFIAQLQALKIKDNKIIDRFDYRLCDDLIENKDLLKMISYDKDLFKYTNDSDLIEKEFIKFIDKDLLLIIDNAYTLDYLSDIKNEKESIINLLDLEMSEDIFDKIMTKYQLEPSNHLVDLLYEALIFENNQ